MNYKLIDFQQPFVLCVSGGIDSMFLLHKTTNYLINLFKHKEFISNFHVVHVNHGISDNSNHWENFVKNETDKINNSFKNMFSVNFPLFQFYSFKLNLKDNNLDLSEKNCREKRYELILDHCVKHNIFQLLTAHHKDDLYENNFISIFKNRIYSFYMLDENVKTWKWKQIKCLKPLLGLNKEQLKNYLDLNDLSHIHDESNDESDNIRNLLRNQLFANLKSLKGASQYLLSMEKFFDLMNFSFNFYSKIIKTKILPNIGFGINYKDNIETVSYYLPFNIFSPYIFNKNYFIQKDGFNHKSEDEQFLIETFNLFFQSKTGYYLTGKHKKFLANNLQNICISNKLLEVINDNKIYFAIEFTLFNKDPLDTIEDKLKNLEKSYFKMIIKNK